MRLGSAIACAGVLLLLTGAAQPVRLQPSSPWVVDYATNSCRLIRTFGEGSSATTLALESAAPNEMNMLIVGKPLKTSREMVSARFLPVGSKAFDGTVVKAVTSGDPGILFSSIPMLPAGALARTVQERDKRRRNPAVRPPPIPVADQESRRALRQQFAAAVTELSIQTHPRAQVILDTGSLGEALSAFDKCSRDSLKDWGVDPDVEDKIVRPVWGVNPSQWLKSDDYPYEMLRDGKQSEVTVRLLVDASGKITKCTTLSHFKEPEFNRISCDRITKRARLEPAELADGTRVPSYYTMRVKFRIAY